MAVRIWEGTIIALSNAMSHSSDRSRANSAASAHSSFGRQPDNTRPRSPVARSGSVDTT